MLKKIKSDCIKDIKGFIQFNMFSSVKYMAYLRSEWPISEVRSFTLS